jgi:ubiquinone/menaquinone biosynthesis C-methylase UbiE
MKHETSKAATYWDEESQRKDSRKSRIFAWDVGSVLTEHAQRKVTGDPHKRWEAYALEEHFAGTLPVERCLSLGVGTGQLERDLAEMGAFQHCDGYDVSPKSVKAAQKAADEAGYPIKYHVADIDTIQLPPNTYDMVWIKSAMHHFSRLEHVCEQIIYTLKPDGLLILDEYVGANRFQFPQRQKEVINAALKLLPEKYRQQSIEHSQFTIERSPTKRSFGKLVSRIIDKIRDGDLLAAIQRRLNTQSALTNQKPLIKTEIRFPTVRDMMAADPSEAVRSEDILPILYEYFDIIEHKERGSSLTLFLLSGIAGNFEEDDPDGQAYLRMLLNIEDVLIETGDISSDSAFIVARPKSK